LSLTPDIAKMVHRALSFIYIFVFTCKIQDLYPIESSYSLSSVQLDTQIKQPMQSKILNNPGYYTVHSLCSHCILEFGI